MTWVHASLADGRASGELVLEGKEAHYLGRVLRSRVGDSLTVFDGQGKTATAHVHALSSRSATLELGDVREHAEESGKVVAQIALIKGERLDYSLQKLTELGVDEIELVTTERTVVKWSAERASSRLARCREITVAASAQSQRPWLPRVVGPTAFTSLELDDGAVGLAMVVHRSEPASLEELIGDWTAQTRVAFAVGPEGGFTEAESSLLVDRGYRATSLGPRILRAETAALTSAVLIGFGLGRYRPHIH